MIFLLTLSRLVFILKTDIEVNGYVDSIQSLLDNIE